MAQPSPIQQCQKLNRTALLTRQDNNSTQKAGDSRRSQLLTKYLPLLESKTSLRARRHSAVQWLPRVVTDATVPLVPWSVPGHQRLDAPSESAGCIAAHEKKKKERCGSYTERRLHIRLSTPNSKSYAASGSLSLVAHENLGFRCNLRSHLALRLKGVSARSK